MNPFTQEKLNSIFKVSPTCPDRVNSRESSWLEFKESFGWKSLPKYLKTSAAYANVNGGYIVFGIKNKPHVMLGLSENGLQSFRNIDPEKMTQNFNEYFDPEINWKIDEYELNNKIFGILYIYESKNKPVICRKDSSNVLKQGEIHYRYRGRTQKIKYSELREILETKRKNEQKLWLKHLSQIARIGVRNAGVFDFHTGMVNGTGGSFLIDETLLSQIAFLKEGQFNEKGAPALRLIGNVEAIGSNIPMGIGVKKIIKTKGIRIGDIIVTFLNQDIPDDPEEYIKQICFESTGFLPVYYYMNLANLDSEKTINILEQVISRRQSGKKLVERLRKKSTQHMNMTNSQNEIADKKRELASQLINKKVDENLSEKNLIYCLQALRTLSPEQIASNSEDIRDLLKMWFNKYYASASGYLAGNLRRAICWVDEALYMERP
ncbi:MAG: ATP-binding protein [Candidatus Eremiobacteraeota bacterium]|nr:ATP-binding protein [Candidatus Eremiobacteraeota bacterium]